MSDGVSPYKGLGYYGERDRPFFFGREDETAIVVANLVAARLTLVYGASGVGKSSLLRAGVARELRDRARENVRQIGTPGAVVVVFPADEESGARRNSWRDDPAAELAAGVENAVADLGLDVEPVDRSLAFTELLEAWSDRLGGDVLFILDQFEEYFLYHAAERGPGSFFDELSRALTRPGLGANVLVSIREDAYSRLDGFKGRIPFLYDNYLRIDRLDRDAARAAIERPVERYNELIAEDGDAVSIEPELVDAILADVQVGQLALGQAALESVAGAAGDTRIETPFLQLVLERLWDEEVGSGSRTLQRATLERLGGGERIVRTHLDAAMASLSENEKSLAARAFRQLVTPSGTKIAHLPSDLAALEDVARERLAPVLDKLAAERILRTIAPPPGQEEPRYEIFHDVLAAAILDWRGRYLRERAELRRRRRVAIGGGILGLLLIAGLVSTLVIVSRLRNKTRNAQDAAFVNEARAAEGFAGVFLPHETVANAAFSPDGRHVLTAGVDGTVAIWDTAGAAGSKGGTLVRTLEDGQLNRARYDPSGRLVVTAGEGGVGVWSLATGDRREVVTTGASDATFDPRGRRIATAGLDGITTVVSWPGLRIVGKFFVPARSAVRSVAFSPDGESIITGNDDGTVRSWRLGGGARPVTYRITTDTVYSVAFGSSGRYFVAGASDGTFSVWDVTTRSPIKRVRTGQDFVLDATFSPDQRYVVAGAGTTAQVWLWQVVRPVLVFNGHTDAVNSAVFNSPGTLVLTGGNDETARLWTVALADLRVDLGTVQIGPSGRTIHATFNVTNVGGGTAMATSVRVSASGFRPIALQVPSLRAGGAYPAEANVPIPPSARGTRVVLLVTANPGDRALEADYDNNTASRQLSVEPPDLVAETKAVAPGAKGSVAVLVEIRNIGTGRAPSTTLVSQPHGYARAVADVPPLGPGKKVRLELELQAKRGAPAQQALVTVDPDGRTGDVNRANNSDLTERLPAYNG